jgi:hypothetical protein
MSVITVTSINFRDGTTQNTALGMAVGSGNNQIFWQNDTNMTTDFTISTGKNAGTFGPVTINSNVTLTVPANSTWSVV